MSSFLEQLSTLSDVAHYGRVNTVQGMLLEVRGVNQVLSIGAHCVVHANDGRRILSEVVGFRNGLAQLMTFGPLDGVGPGSRVERLRERPTVRPSSKWLGRVVNAFGEPLDGKGTLPSGRQCYDLCGPPPAAHQRRRVRGRVDLGVRSLNTFTTCCSGQRLGIFAGSGVGKSVLLAMLARYSSADVIVIGLVGERGREVQEWLEDDLGEEGLAKAVVVVATSDEPPLVRRQAAQLTLTLAEYYRDQGKEVLCLMDSVTRYAMALREIGLSAGEPPATKGYPPSVFAELPKLLERAGPGTGEGAVTGLFTVLVEGGDHDEPIADAVRGILDGHIVLDRNIAERNRFPAVNILRSVSRTVPACLSEEERAVTSRARALLAAYEDMAELIRIGAYKRGSDPMVDEAIDYNPRLEAFLAQDKNEHAPLATGFRELAELLGHAAPDESTARFDAALSRVA